MLEGLPRLSADGLVMVVVAGVAVAEAFANEEEECDVASLVVAYCGCGAAAVVFGVVADDDVADDDVAAAEVGTRTVAGVGGVRMSAAESDLGGDLERDGVNCKMGCDDDCGYPGWKFDVAARTRVTRDSMSD